MDFNCAWLCTERMSSQFRKSPSWCCGLEDTVSRSGKAAPTVLCAVAAAGARSLLLSGVQPRCHTLAEDWSQVCRFAVKCVCGCGEANKGLVCCAADFSCTHANTHVPAFPGLFVLSSSDIQIKCDTSGLEKCCQLSSHGSKSVRVSAYLSDAGESATRSNSFISCNIYHTLFSISIFDVL